MSTTEESIQAPAHAAPTTKGGAVGYYIDDRLASASFTKRLVDKVFPDHSRSRTHRGEPKASNWATRMK